MSQGAIESVCKVLGDTQFGFTGSEIGRLLAQCGIEDTAPTDTKWRRLYAAFNYHPDAAYVRAAVFNFISKSMDPGRFVGDADRHKGIRHNLNQALAFAGAQLGENGQLYTVPAVATISEAEARADDLRSSLEPRNIHQDVLRCCRKELLTEDYFHAVFEASKSIFDKIRILTGLEGDGGRLVDAALGGETPILAINARSSDSEISEQKGFANLIRGTYGMFRNPTAHELRIRWRMRKADAEDLLSLASLIHRRLDQSRRLR